MLIVLRLSRRARHRRAAGSGLVAQHRDHAARRCGHVGHDHHAGLQRRRRAGGADRPTSSLPSLGWEGGVLRLRRGDGRAGAGPAVHAARKRPLDGRQGQAGAPRSCRCSGVSTRPSRSGPTPASSLSDERKDTSGENRRWPSTAELFSGSLACHHSGDLGRLFLLEHSRSICRASLRRHVPRSARHRAHRSGRHCARSAASSARSAGCCCWP